MSMGEWKNQLVTEHICAECHGSFHQDYDDFLLTTCRCGKNKIAPPFSVLLNKWASIAQREMSSSWRAREELRQKQKAQAERAMDIYLIDD